MNHPPNKIYLQWQSEDGEESEEVTWCTDPIYDGDAEYQLVGTDYGSRPSQAGLYGSPIHMPGLLRQIRLARGITLRQLADEIDISVSTLSSWERNIIPVNLDRLQLWAKALDVTVSFHIDRSIL